MSGRKHAGIRGGNFARGQAAEARAARCRAEEKKRKQAPAPADATAEPKRENPHDRILRKLAEDRQKNGI